MGNMEVKNRSSFCGGTQPVGGDPFGVTYQTSYLSDVYIVIKKRTKL